MINEHGICLFFSYIEDTDSIDFIISTGILNIGVMIAASSRRSVLFNLSTGGQRVEIWVYVIILYLDYRPDNAKVSRSLCMFSNTTAIFSLQWSPPHPSQDEAYYSIRRLLVASNLFHIHIYSHF